ncbi:hypothetical protein Tco_0424913 [Tanacetum coccineum]
MNSVAAKQVALDNDLVPPEKRLKIEKCNARIEFSKPQREETYQVTLDALKLSLCYPAFLITAEVPEICSRLLNQDFVKPPSEDELVPFIYELGYSGKCASLGKQQDLIDSENQELRSCRDKTISMRNMINLHTVRDDTLLATPKKARKFKKVASPSRKLSHVLEEEPVVKPKRAKRPAKKSTIVPTASVVIRDTPSESVPKKKTPAKVDRGKGMYLLSNVALLEDAQLKKTLKKSKLETYKLYANGLGEDVGGDEVTKDDDDDDVNSDADDDKEASDSEKTDSDEDEIPNLNQNDDEEEEHEEEHSTDHINVILTTVHETQKTEVPVQSSFVSSDFANQFLNLDNVLPTNTEVVSMMNVKVRHEEPSTQTPLLLNIPVTVIPKTSTATKSTIPPTIQPITPLQQQSTPTPTPAPTTATTTNSVPALPDFSSLFRFDQRKSFRSYTIEFEKKAKDERKRYIDLVDNFVKEIIKDEVNSQLPQIIPKEVSDYATPVIQSSINESLENIVLAKCSSQPKSTYEVAASLTEFKLKKILLGKIQKSKSYQGTQEHKDLYDALRDREDKDKDEDPPVRSDQGLKRQKTSKDARPSRGSKSKESKSSSSKGSTSQPKSSGKLAQAEEPVFEVADIKLPLNQGDDVGNSDDKLNVKASPRDDCKIAKAEKPPLTFDELMSTPIDFSTYVMINLKIENLTQEHLIGPAFNLLKGTCKSRVEPEYHFEECYKAVTD